jgi:hypothetical protein
LEAKPNTINKVFDRQKIQDQFVTKPCRISQFGIGIQQPFRFCVIIHGSINELANRFMFNLQNQSQAR